MKKILLISDTHGYLDPALQPHIGHADEVWHAGDIGSMELADSISKQKPFRAVYGNIDDVKARMHFPEHLNFVCEGMNVLILHIGGYPGRYSTLANTLIEQFKPGLFICGHSHILKVVPDRKYNLLHMNPGACGVHGFHQVKTALRFEIESGKIRNPAVIELGKRAALND